MDNFSNFQGKKMLQNKLIKQLEKMKRYRHTVIFGNIYIILDTPSKEEFTKKTLWDYLLTLKPYTLIPIYSKKAENTDTIPGCIEVYSHYLLYSSEILEDGKFDTTFTIWSDYTDIYDITRDLVNPV